MAKMISAETVEEVWQRISMSSIEDAEEMHRNIQEKEPVLMHYLVTVADKNFNDYDAQILYYLGIVSWQIMKLSDPPVRQIVIDTIEQAERENLTQLEVLATQPVVDLMSSTQAMLADYPEPAVLRYIIEALHEVDDEDDEHGEPPMSEEALGMAFLYLKTALDAMIASR